MAILEIQKQNNQSSCEPNAHISVVHNHSHEIIYIVFSLAHVKTPYIALYYAKRNQFESRKISIL